MGKRGPAVRFVVSALLGAIVLVLAVATAHGNLMFDNADCWSCHDGYWHGSGWPVERPAVGTEYISCSISPGCHPVGWYDGMSFTEVSWDHGQRYAPEYYLNCTWCHNPSYVEMPQHTTASVDAAHDTTVGFTDECAKCHSADLVLEHGEQCGYCHDGVDPAIAAVVADWDRSCSACHDVQADAETGHIPLHDGGLPDPSCNECHSDNTSSEHGDACALCHQSTIPVVIDAIAANDVTCGACHDSRFHYLGATLDPYLSWEIAALWMTENDVNPALRTSPHGGYVATTTKCAVCHSVHRAASDVTKAGVGSYWKLTPGALACVACHTPTGSNPTNKLVEWSSTYVDGGPHRSFNCMSACHGSVHGGNASEYGAMNAYLLTPDYTRSGNYVDRDAAIAAAFAAGNVSGNTTETAGGSSADIYGSLYANINDTTFREYTTTNNQDLSTMRAMATGYTCGSSGCHNSSQMAVNQRGYAEGRAGNPAAAFTLDTYFTGHMTNTVSGCAPCHGVSVIAGAPTSTPDSKCGACHDMVGAATNSTAFPHANRNITVRERSRDNTATGNAWTVEHFDTTKFVGARNLWMYFGDATYRDASGEPTATPDYLTRTAERIVLENATVSGGSGGLYDAGDIRDGVCMKCHGYEEWPVHGMSSTHTYGGRDHLNFSKR